MKRYGIIAAMVSLLTVSCNGQTRNADKKTNDKNKPDVNIKVNRKYDKNGNVISYDSTYSSVYSNFKNDTLKRDSIMRSFENGMNQKFSFSDDPFFKDFFFGDSVKGNDFFSRGFFSNRFKNILTACYRAWICLKMNSLKNTLNLPEFLKRQVRKDCNFQVPQFLKSLPRLSFLFIDCLLDDLRNSTEIYLPCSHHGEILYYKELFRESNVWQFSAHLPKHLCLVHFNSNGGNN